MRVSRLMLVTLRDDPSEAEIPSHKLLLRAGYIRRVASGIYAYLPLMWRVLQKVSRVVREEIIFKGYGRVRDVVTGPDGLLYLAMNSPGRIARLVPDESVAAR